MMYEGEKIEKRERDFENVREARWREKGIYGGAGMRACLCFCFPFYCSLQNVF